MALYLVVEPVLSIQSAQVVHGQHVALVIHSECFGQGGSGRALEGLYKVLDHCFPNGQQSERTHTLLTQLV